MQTLLFRAPGNAILDASTFIGDVVGDIPGAVIDKAANVVFLLIHLHKKAWKEIR